jgi:predicted anti-sigma-YlaC factor YlaD
VLLRLRVVLPALWAGLLICIAAIATPAVFAVVPSGTAGQIVGRIFAQESVASMVLALVVVMIERRLSPGRQMGVGLALGALFCTVAGYYALQPMMQAARAGQGGALSFGQLHAISLGFFALKGLLVLALAWRAAGVRPLSS